MTVSHRKPKGTYTRNTPDWFADRLCSAGGYARVIPQAFNAYQTFALYNDDAGGRALAVYFISAFWDGAAVIFGDLYQGQFGTPGNQGQLVTEPGTAASGIIGSSRTVVAGNPGNTDITNPTLFLGLGFASGGIGYNAPLAIVPPTMSLRLSNDVVCAEAGVTFWYTIMDARV